MQKERLLSVASVNPHLARPGRFQRRYSTTTATPTPPIWLTWKSISSVPTRMPIWTVTASLTRPTWQKGLVKGSEPFYRGNIYLHLSNNAGLIWMIMLGLSTIVFSAIDLLSRITTQLSDRNFNSATCSSMLDSSPGLISYLTSSMPFSAGTANSSPGDAAFTCFRFPCNYESVLFFKNKKPTLVVCTQPVNISNLIIRMIRITISLERSSAWQISRIKSISDAFDRCVPPKNYVNFATVIE